MLLLQQAIFLRGVNDPADPGRITTTLYRPKHKDLRYEAGFVRSGDVLVPLDNVVELRSISPEATPSPVQVIAGVEWTTLELNTPGTGSVGVHPSTPVIPVENTEKPVEEAHIRRRGRPRKNPVE